MPLTPEANVVTIQKLTPNGDPIEFGTVRYLKGNDDDRWFGNDGADLSQELMKALVVVCEGDPMYKVTIDTIGEAPPEPKPTAKRTKKSEG